MRRRADLVPAFARETERASDAAEGELLDALGLLALLLRPIPPSARSRERLLTTICRKPVRLLPFLERLSELFDLGLDPLQEVLVEVDDPERWRPGPLPGTLLFHLEGGPRRAGADCGLVQLAPGFALPRHRHLGDERVLVLEGGYREDTGRVFLPGDVHHMPRGTLHGYRVFDDGPCLCALVLYEGVEF
jgi:quercetin dioxygenase-like cupin family protein